MARKKADDGLVEVRVTHPNISITRPDGEPDLRPQVGEVIRVRKDQVEGGLKGKVRLLSDEPGTPSAGPALTVETAREFLAKRGLAVFDPTDTEEVAGMAGWLKGQGYGVTGPEPNSEGDKK